MNLTRVNSCLLWYLFNSQCSFRHIHEKHEKDLLKISFLNKLHNQNCSIKFRIQELARSHVKQFERTVVILLSKLPVINSNLSFIGIIENQQYKSQYPLHKILKALWMKWVHTLVLSGKCTTAGMLISLTELIVIEVFYCVVTLAPLKPVWTICVNEEKECSFLQLCLQMRGFRADDMRCLSDPGDRSNISKSNCQNKTKFTWVMGVSQLRGRVSIK